MRYLLQNIKKNVAFWVFMYVLGIVTAYVVLPQTRNAKIYDHLYTELFVDVSVLFLFLSLLPQKISVWIKRVFYVIAYSLAIVDVYCFIKFGSTLTPTMLLLVGETNAQEAGEFLKSYLSADMIFSKLKEIRRNKDKCARRHEKNTLDSYLLPLVSYSFHFFSHRLLAEQGGISSVDVISDHR